MDRYIKKHVQNDLSEKIVLISGPRQVGKTTLSKHLIDPYDYFNFDSSRDRLLVQEKRWDRTKSLIIFDELHKMKKWKSWIKGVYDTEGIPPSLLVTGSAKLEIHKRVGDSLAGRYFQHRMHPIDVKEAVSIFKIDPEEAFSRLWSFSGFPEPFFKDNQVFHRRWQKTHTDIILKQDIVDLTSVRDIDAIITLTRLLAQRVGSNVSYANLAKDLERDANTIKRWLALLENLYVIYRVTPYHKRVARSLLKEPKFYFYDHTLVEDKGARLENIVASALKKEIHLLEDTLGMTGELHYLRTKDGVELDFLVSLNEKPSHIFEVKSKEDTPAKGFRHFAPLFPDCNRIQLVQELDRDQSLPDGTLIKRLLPWLENLSLQS